MRQARSRAWSLSVHLCCPCRLPFNVRANDSLAKGCQKRDDESIGRTYRSRPKYRHEVELSGRLSEVAYFDIHGGGFLVGGGEMCQLLARFRATEFGTDIYSVDYRLLPEHPFPAGLDDCLSAY